jgi:ankyrin repeat protein
LEKSENELFLAIINSRPIQPLLDAKADINVVVSNTGSGLVQRVIKHMHDTKTYVDILPLLEAKADVNGSGYNQPLLTAIIHLTPVDGKTSPKAIQIVEQLLVAKANPSSVSWEHTALMLAVMHGESSSVSLLRLLIDARANVNASTADGTALHYATSQSCTEKCRFLLDNGAYPSLTIRNQWNDTPLRITHRRALRDKRDCYNVLKAAAASCGLSLLELLSKEMDTKLTSYSFPVK